MFVGHGLLAFALVALGAERLGWSRAAALRVAALAALFATLPDVDILYALRGLFGVTPAMDAAVESFWNTGNRVHRGLTHSLVVAAVTTAAVALASRPERLARAVSVPLFAGLVVVSFVVDGPLSAGIATLFVAGAATLVAVGGRWALPPAGVAAAAGVGLFTHPFGDLFTGEPPAFLYPFDVTLLTDHVALSADPTLHLLAAFALELSVVWLATAVYFRSSGRRLAAHVDRRAVLGTGYAGAVLAMPAPTLDVSYHFVFSVLAVGVVGVTPPPFERAYSPRGAVTALAAVTLAAAAYAVVYVAV